MNNSTHTLVILVGVIDNRTIGAKIYPSESIVNCVSSYKDDTHGICFHAPIMCGSERECQKSLESLKKYMVYTGKPKLLCNIPDPVLFGKIKID